jgi:hypothetical protein
MIQISFNFWWIFTINPKHFNLILSTTAQAFTAFNDVQSIVSYSNTNSSASQMSQSLGSQIEEDVPLEVAVQGTKWWTKEYWWTRYIQIEYRIIFITKWTIIYCTSKCTEKLRNQFEILNYHRILSMTYKLFIFHN